MQAVWTALQAPEKPGSRPHLLKTADRPTFCLSFSPTTASLSGRFTIATSFLNPVLGAQTNKGFVCAEGVATNHYKKLSPNWQVFLVSPRKVQTLRKNVIFWAPRKKKHLVGHNRREPEFSRPVLDLFRWMKPFQEEIDVAVLSVTERLLCTLIRKIP